MSKTASAGGLNIPEFKQALIQRVPHRTQDIINARLRSVLHDICVQENIVTRSGLIPTVQQPSQASHSAFIFMYA